MTYHTTFRPTFVQPSWGGTDFSKPGQRSKYYIIEFDENLREWIPRLKGEKEEKGSDLSPFSIEIKEMVQKLDAEREEFLAEELRQKQQPKPQEKEQPKEQTREQERRRPTHSIISTYMKPSSIAPEQTDNMSDDEEPEQHPELSSSTAVKRVREEKKVSPRTPDEEPVQKRRRVDPTSLLSRISVYPDADKLIKDLRTIEIEANKEATHSKYHTIKAQFVTENNATTFEETISRILPGDQPACFATLSDEMKGRIKKLDEAVEKTNST